MDTWTLTVKKKKKYFLKFRGSSLLWSHCILEAQITSGCQISTYALTVNSRLVHYSMVDTCMVCRAQTRTLPFQILHVFYSLWASCIAVSECFVSCNNQPVSISSAVWLIERKEIGCSGQSCPFSHWMIENHGSEGYWLRRKLDCSTIF